MAGLSREDFDSATKEILAAWERAQTRDQGFQVIREFGRKYGFKNVIAAIEGRTPKRFSQEQSVTDWVEERHKEESST
jgi:hypothetical protein